MFDISFALSCLASIVACLGVRAGIVGIFRRRAAGQIRENARERYEKSVAIAERPFRSALELAGKYGQLQVRVKNRTIARFLALLDRLGQQIPAEDRAMLENLEGFSNDRLREYGTILLEPDDFAVGSLKALRANHSLDRLAFGLIGFFGVGALDRSTLLGWLSSGASRADLWFANPATLAGIVLVPMVTLGGFFLRGAGERSLREARQYEARIEEEMIKVAAFEDFCGLVSRHLSELLELVRVLNRQAIEGLNELESRMYASGATLVRSGDVFVGSLSFDADRDTAKLQEVAGIVRVLAEIGGRPVLDGDGKLDREAVTLVEKYGATFGQNALEKG
ncbi:hypothetical protein V0288_13890 [Pannus brasiliensis CCIBt3594]|uniref:Uncharacterized protein n=1 Tax=Pannus brasiliensis CCIBt3594 TaxID=1427578 RepID=A0AAW9QXK6_9CHRO